MTVEYLYTAQATYTCQRCRGTVYQGDRVTLDDTHIDWVCDRILNPPTGKSEIELELEPFGFAWQDEQRSRA